MGNESIVYKCGEKYRLRDKRILIYGAGDKGRRVLDVLACENIAVEAFLDKRAQAYIGFQGVPVVAPDSLVGYGEKGDYAVIITVKNAYAHNEIALKLKEMGFYNLIFMPLYVLKGGMDNQVLNAVMRVNSELTDQYKVPPGEIPSVEREDLSVLHRADLFIELSEGKVKAYVPAELLHMPMAFQNAWQISEKDKRINHNMLVSYYAVYMYEEFARGCIDENAEGLGTYLTEAKETSRRNGMPVDQAWKNNFISGKLMVFQSMKNQLALHPDFFRENCAEVSFETPSHFRVNGTGKNRISFLLSQGYQYVPVIMSGEDYNRYLNEEALKAVQDILGGAQPDFPISHPAFFEQYSGAEDYLRLWLIPVARKILESLKTRLAGRSVSEVTCLDGSDDWGNTSRFLSLLGFRVKRSDGRSITEALDRLFYVSADVWECVGEPKIFLYSNRSDEKSDGEDKIWEMLSNGVSVCFVQCWDGNLGILQTIYERGFTIRDKLFSTYWQERPVTGYCLEKQI